jgi:hypothetical protein
LKGIALRLLPNTASHAVPQWLLRKWISVLSTQTFEKPPDADLLKQRSVQVLQQQRNDRDHPGKVSILFKNLLPQLQKYEEAGQPPEADASQANASRGAIAKGTTTHAIKHFLKPIILNILQSKVMKYALTDNKKPSTDKQWYPYHLLSGAFNDTFFTQLRVCTLISHCMTTILSLLHIFYLLSRTAWHVLQRAQPFQT